jgi:hypothetical protein
MTNDGAIPSYLPDALKTALSHTRKAMRRGDIAIAERWHRLAVREMKMHLDIQRAMDWEHTHEMKEERLRKAIQWLDNFDAMGRRARRSELPQDLGGADD